MGIKNVAVTAITETSATVTWATDDAGNTGLQYGEVTGGSCTYTTMPYKYEMVRTHSYDITGLTGGKTYRVLPMSQDDTGMDYSVSDSTAPQDFTTSSPASAVTASSISAAARSAVKLGSSITGLVKALDASGAAVSGVEIKAGIINNPSSGTRGTITPVSGITDASGTVNFTFTGTLRGTAEIKLTCGSVEKTIRVWVCKTVVDFIMALLGIPF